MTDDLYNALGVPRDADKAAIRKAYRNRSKKAHPDGGGSPEKFALVKLAVDILSDAARRANYDKTGQAAPPEPDNELSGILQFVSTALDKVIEKEHQNGTIDYIMSKDVLSNMVREIQSFDREALTKIRNHEKAMLLDGDLAAKFQRKHKTDQPNLMASLLSSRASQNKAQIEALKKLQATAAKALEFLNDYRFSVEYMSEADKRRAGMSIFAGILGNTRF